MGSFPQLVSVFSLGVRRRRGFSPKVPCATWSKPNPKDFLHFFIFRFATAKVANHPNPPFGRNVLAMFLVANQCF